jgi:hypothetical protein
VNNATAQVSVESALLQDATKNKQLGDAIESERGITRKFPCYFHTLLMVLLYAIDFFANTFHKQTPKGKVVSGSKVLR